MSVDAGDGGEWWRFGPERVDERCDRAGITFDLHDDAAGIVEHETREPVVVSKPVDERPEAHALNHPANAQA